VQNADFAIEPAGYHGAIDAIGARHGTQEQMPHERAIHAQAQGSRPGGTEFQAAHHPGAFIGDNEQVTV
jgi:hypothetical protein